MSAFAWPICLCSAILIFALVFIFKFRDPIVRLIDRVKHIGKTGVTTADTSALATQAGVKENFAKSPVDEALQIFDNQLLLEQETIITNFLNEKNIQNANERERVLTRYLASAYTTLRFESVYYNIYGSQLRALQMLNESAPNGLPLEIVQAWYEFGKTSYPNLYGENGEYTFEKWLNYMSRMTLVKTIDTTIHATVFAQEFLKYLIQSSYSLDKKG